MRIRIVDAFTYRPFAGNPAGVVLLDTFPDDTWLQNVARDVNHPETAFAHRRRRIMVNVAAVYGSPDEARAQDAWVEALADSLRGDDDAYVNFVGDEGANALRTRPEYRKPWVLPEV